MSAMDEVYIERLRQYEHGYDEEHDDGHSAFDLADAAAAILVGPRDNCESWIVELAQKYDRRRITERRRWTIAAAMLVAAIERSDREMSAIARAERGANETNDSTIGIGPSLSVGEAENLRTDAEAIVAFGYASGGGATANRLARELLVILNRATK